MQMKQIRLPENSSELDEYIENKKISYSGELLEQVGKIIASVQKEGDQALLDFTEVFDQVKLVKIAVEQDYLQSAKVDSSLLSTLTRVKDRIAEFSRRQQEQSWFKQRGGRGFVGEQVTPLDRVGLYIPGGRAAYPSSVLMTAVPALVAGVKEIVAVTPPNSKGKINPVVARTLNLCGIDEVYAVGGAQAIAALAWGTETITPVDKIVGPGNKYVTMAKKLAFGQVDIDMLAGPSEILIVADGSAKPASVAADLLAQAEHDPEARAVLITTEAGLVLKVELELEKQLNNLATAPTAREALEENGLIIHIDDMNSAIEVVNKIAPEHLELIIENPLDYLDRIRHAGSIFMGPWTPEVTGDYLAGPNHVLPTSGTARFSSPLSVNDFIKKSGLIYFTRAELEATYQDIKTIAEAELLPAHAQAAAIRLNELGDGNG